MAAALSSSSAPSGSTGVVAAGGARSALDEVDASGAFKRTESVFRTWVGTPEHPAEADRYHLVVSYACPWASRCLAFRALKGLEDAISVSVVHPVWESTRPGVDDHRGWVFREDPAFPGCADEPLFGASSVREIYERVDPSAHKFTVPILFDKVSRTIVSNESADITRMFNSSFNAIAKHPDLDLFPEDLRAEIEGLNAWIYEDINNGVYRCGFAKKQAPYEEAMEKLFAALDRCEAILSDRRYLCGARLTEADIRLFVTLIRFDEVYTVHFKTNRRMIREYPNLLNYTRELYQLPAITGTVHFDHIKHHYYRSHPGLNPLGLVPVGFPLDWTAPHGRERLG